MNNIIKLENIEGMILVIRNQRVVLDADIAVIYGVETKRINEAVKNNPDKFPPGYILELTPEELTGLRSKFSTAKLAKTRTLPKAFTEKGLYMLATILKSQVATQATLNIIETFSKLRELSRNVKELANLAAHSYETDYPLIAEHFNGLHAMRLQLYRTAGNFLDYCQSQLHIEPANRDFTLEFYGIVTVS